MVLQPANLKIREAKTADAAAILDCLAQAFAPYEQQYTPEAFADTVLDEISLTDRLRKMRVLVAVDNSRIVGTVGGSIRDNREGHLRGMAVLPTYQVSGVAALLLRAIESDLRVMGCIRVTLDTTMPLQAAIRFYEKHGYVRSGVVTDFFGMPLIEYVKEL